MNIVLAVSLNDPLTLLFGILVAGVVGAGAGFVVGTRLGVASPSTPLATTIRLTRERLSAASGRLDGAAKRMKGVDSSEVSGRTRVLSGRVSDLSSGLAAVERKAKHTREVSD